LLRVIIAACRCAAHRGSYTWRLRQLHRQWKVRPQPVLLAVHMHDRVTQAWKYPFLDSNTLYRFDAIPPVFIGRSDPIGFSNLIRADTDWTASIGNCRSYWRAVFTCSPCGPLFPTSRESQRNAGSRHNNRTRAVRTILKVSDWGRCPHHEAARAVWNIYGRHHPFTEPRKRPFLWPSFRAVPDYSLHVTVWKSSGKLF
jgi:hypothetical protein